jgi:hypothetical protein
VIEEEEGQFEVKEAGNESDASSEESQPDSKSGSESGYSSDSEAELKPKKRKRNVVEDDKVDASSEEPKTDAAPEDQELTDIKIDETVVKPEGDTDTPSAPIHKEEAALPGKGDNAVEVPPLDDEDVSVVYKTNVNNQEIKLVN